MTTFREGGTCATPMTLRQRNEARIRKVARDMGAAYLLHPENKKAKWGKRV
jgi:hypothetical protein